MFSLEASQRYFMCQHPVNIRKGIDSLFNLIQAESPLSPMSGDVFVFFSKNRQSVKLLRWDTDGFLLYHKSLERGSFEMPHINPSTGYYELSWETFSFIMSDVSLESVRFRKFPEGRVVVPLVYDEIKPDGKGDGWIAYKEGKKAAFFHLDGHIRFVYSGYS